MRLFYLFLVFPFVFFAQNRPYYFQQHVDYQMDVNMNVKNFQYFGKQTLVYTNNSNDTLRKVFYHLFNNSFQPGSEMDIRLQTIKDPDKRMVKSFKINNIESNESRISTLKPDEIGYMNISNFKQDGVLATTKVVSTILEVTLPKPILPNSKTTFTLDYNAQVPLQIRRNGRNSEEGIALSMAQWYPKICEFDFEGWHADPYIGREFHGVWGNFDVKITIDKDYTIGSTGYLQNPNEIGHGYEDKGLIVKHSKKTKTLTWHFIAPNVMDFTWGADNDFAHDKITTEDNIDIHFFYKKNPLKKPSLEPAEVLENWKKLQPKTVELMDYFNNTIGKYPYKQYSVIQGGDGGMEYPMCTLITGNRKFNSLVGVTAHELAHSWFQHLLGTNESKHEWMDEGFTTFISDLAMMKVIGGKQNDGTFLGNYNNYYRMVASGKEQPQSTHADRYDENTIYGISSYSKGCVFLAQLGYIIGFDNLFKTLKRYYQEYKFTHPTPNDFKRTAERVSGAVLDWYLLDWTQTTNTIDYGIESVDESGKVTLKRIGRTPMPLDILVEYKDNTQEAFYIPNPLMRWEKDNQNPSIQRTVLTGWNWAFPKYDFQLSKPKSEIKNITIDPSNFMADVNRENNKLVKD